MEVRAAIREDENVHKKKDLAIFGLQGTKSTFLQPWPSSSYIDRAKLSSINRMLLKRGMGNGEWEIGVSGNTKKIKLESAQ